MIALVLVALSVGVSNLVASVGIGAGGVNRGTRLRVAVIFGLLEAGMPVIGLLIGHGLASAVGRETRWLAAGLLMAIGGYGIFRTTRSQPRGEPDRPGQAPGASREHAGGPGPESARLLVSGLALSADNLAAGFALGSYQVSVAAGAVVFGVVSAAMSLAGLELGARSCARAGARGELAGSVVLIGVGAAIGLGILGLPGRPAARSLLQAQRRLRAGHDRMPDGISQRRRDNLHADVQDVLVVYLEDLGNQSRADRVGLAGIAINSHFHRTHTHSSGPLLSATTLLLALIARPEQVRVPRLIARRTPGQRAGPGAEAHRQAAD